MDKPQSKPAETKWPAWLTKHQVAARLGKSVSAVLSLQERGYLHPLLKNGVRHFPLAEIEALARPGRPPSPWFASPGKSGRATAAVSRRTEGQEAANVFRLLHQGMSLRDIVMRARVPPHRVRALHREWTRSLDQGAPPDSHALGDDPDLTTLASAAEQLFARDD